MQLRKHVTGGWLQTASLRAQSQEVCLCSRKSEFRVPPSPKPSAHVAAACTATTDCGHGHLLRHLYPTSVPHILLARGSIWCLALLEFHFDQGLIRLILVAIWFQRLLSTRRRCSLLDHQSAILSFAVAKMSFPLRLGIGAFSQIGFVLKMELARPRIFVAFLKCLAGRVHALYAATMWQAQLW